LGPLKPSGSGTSSAGARATHDGRDHDDEAEAEERQAKQQEQKVQQQQQQQGLMVGRAPSCLRAGAPQGRQLARRELGLIEFDLSQLGPASGPPIWGELARRTSLGQLGLRAGLARHQT